MDGTGLPYTVATADIDEKAVTAGFSDRSRADPAALTVAIAKAKAEAIMKKLKEEDPGNVQGGSAHGGGQERGGRGDGVLLITTDQVAFHLGTIREKPDTEEVRPSSITLRSPATISLPPELAPCHSLCWITVDLVASVGFTQRLSFLIRSAPFWLSFSSTSHRPHSLRLHLIVCSSCSFLCD